MKEAGLTAAMDDTSVNVAGSLFSVFRTIETEKRGSLAVPSCSWPRNSRSGGDHICECIGLLVVARELR